MRSTDVPLRGFTLLEILIATGLFAIAVTGLIALFPTVQRVSREGEEEARATLIAENILDTLTLPSRPGAFSLATGSSGRSLCFEPALTLGAFRGLRSSLRAPLSFGTRKGLLAGH